MKVVDLFCGCGGFSLGFEATLKFDIIYALDKWEIACKSYKANFPYVDVDCRDALEVKPSEIPTADIIIGGPPCQEFSVAKARGKNNPRTFDTSLIDWFLDVVDYIKPKYWIMENVPPTRNFIKTNCMKRIYRMCDYGVPQIRRRLFVGIFIEPKKAPCKVVFPAVLASEIKGGIIERAPILGVRLGSCFRRRSLILFSAPQLTPSITWRVSFPQPALVDIAIAGSSQYTLASIQLQRLYANLMSLLYGNSCPRRVGKRCLSLRHGTGMSH